MNKETYHDRLALDDAENWGLGAQTIPVEKIININSSDEKKNLASSETLVDLYKSFDVSILRDEMSKKLPYIEGQDSISLSAVILYWYATRKKCLKYLEVGIHGGSPSTSLVIANPGASLTYINSWKNSYEVNDALWSPMRITGALNNVCKHRGSVRFLNGPIETAADRLPAAIGKDCLFNIIHIDLRHVNIDLLNLKRFSSWVCRGGMLVLKIDRSKNFTHTSIDETIIGWSSIEFKKYDTIAFFNIKNTDSALDKVNTLICNESFDLLKPSRVARIMELMLTKAGRCFAFCYYASLWQWPKLIFNNLLLRWQR